eukprot:559592-Rhodomonas_salina.1
MASRWRRARSRLKGVLRLQASPCRGAGGSRWWRCCDACSKVRGTPRARPGPAAESGGVRPSRCGGGE